MDALFQQLSRQLQQSEEQTDLLLDEARTSRAEIRSIFDDLSRFSKPAQALISQHLEQRSLSNNQDQSTKHAPKNHWFFVK